MVRAAALVFALAITGLQPRGIAAQQVQGEAAPPVVGQVVDAESLAPLSTVEVSVQTLSDDAEVVAGGLTDGNGRFRLSGVPAGSYRVVFRRLGYSDDVRAVVVARDGEVVDLGSVALAPAAVQLAEVNVVSERAAVVVEADRDVYLVDALPSSAGGSATDVLSNIPDLEVDVNGRVTLQGQAPAIYINGREAPMTGEALELFLQQFPAENIENIEVMANPSARYEAEGTGGIVNIVLKRGVSLGLTGNAFLNGGTRGQVGAGARATYQSGPLSIMGGTFLRLSRNETDTYDLRQNLLADPITWLEQDGFSDRSNWSGNIDLRAEYMFGEETELTAEARVFRNSSDAERLTVYTERDDDQDVLDRYDRVSVDSGKGNSADFALALEREFAGSDRELSIEIEYSAGDDGEQSTITRRVLEDLGVVDYATELTWDDERETESEFGLDLDYTHPWGELGQIELGYRGEFGRTDESRRQEIEIVDSPATPVTTLTDGFVHNLSVNSMYLTLMRRFGDLRAQLGMRGEHARTTLDVPGGEGSFSNDHLSVFPNANLTYSFADGMRLRLSYSMRIRRPGSNVLNPTNRSDDPMDIEIGNPDINPQYTHSVGLDASWSGELGMLRFSPFYRHSLDQWERFTTVDADGVSTTTWANLGETRSLGASMSASVRNYHGFGGSINLNGQRQRYNWGEQLNQPPRTTFRWSIRTNLNARVSSTLNLQGAVTYNPPRDLPQGRTSGSVMTRLGIRQRLLDNRASVNLNITDPFDLYRSTTRRSDATYVEVGSQRESARRLNVSISYNFGARGGRGGGGRGGGPGGGPRGGGPR